MGIRFEILFQKITLLILVSSQAYAIDCSKDPTLEKINNLYATGFTIYKGYEYYLIKTQKQKLLITKNKRLSCNGYLKITLPISRIVATSTTYLPSLDMLNVHETLVGFPNTKLITTERIIKRVLQGQVKHLTYPLNLEEILLLNPNLILAYSSGPLGQKRLRRLEKFKQKIIYISEYEEKNPLARAEWIKFISIFYNKLDEANKLFKKINDDYQKLKQKVSGMQKPLVIVGHNRGGIWSAPSGNSDLVSLILDAGGNYVWFNKKTSQTLSMNMEAVWSDLVRGDIWLTQNTWFSMADLTRSDPKYLRLNVVKKNKVYNHILNINKWKHMNYWETAMMRPDLLLRDLIIIFHPAVLKNKKTLWYGPLD